jgi:hypothetical protein
MSEQATKIPDNHVLAVMPSQNASQSAMSDLKRNGFGENTVMRGEAVAREVDPKGENSGPIGKVVKALADHMSEQQNYLAQYEEEARNGNAVLAVHVKGQEEAEAAKEILERYSARNIRFFGKLAVTDMTPLTNPSSRSAESPESKNWSQT